jgi:hypothetical protein
MVGFGVVALGLGGVVLARNRVLAGEWLGCGVVVPEGWMGTVSAHDRFVINVSVGAALGQTFAPQLPSPSASAPEGASAGPFEFCSGLVDLVVGVGCHRGGGHRFTLSGERFVGLVAEDIA